MAKPARYFVEFGQPKDDDDDPANYRKERNFEDLLLARSFAAKINRQHGAADVYERFDFVDTTPDGDPLGLLWDYEVRMIDEEEEPV